jgi:hypothetical protein
MSTICKKEFEDTKGATRIRKLKHRQHNGHKPPEKIKYSATQIQLKFNIYSECVEAKLYHSVKQFFLFKF